jgi:hypothetical protein
MGEIKETPVIVPIAVYGGVYEGSPNTVSMGFPTV